MQIGEYRLNSPDEIDTPAYLVYEDMVHHNIREVLRVCGSAEKVVPHVKTHKSAEVLKLQIAAGMNSYKCATLREAELLAEHGVSEIIIAYPMAHPAKLKRLVTLLKLYPEIEFKAIASAPGHLTALSEVAQTAGVELGVYVDLDTGMHRTGVQPGQEAGGFYSSIAATPGLKALGAHVFDGHTLYKPPIEERTALVDKSIEYMHDLWDRAAKQGIDVVDNIAGGSWSFHLYLKEERLRVSPGTWVYWDSRNATMSELPFKVAAVVLSQVIDADPDRDTVTLDAGSKSVSPDQPVEHRFKVVGHPNAVLTAQSEEHGVVALNGEKLEVGEMVLVAPGHACTTMVKFPHALVVDGNGDVVGRYGHQARDR
jgi:D-serine deaminase-like pyridoxal phosphate-dependent protein